MLLPIFLALVFVYAGTILYKRQSLARRRKFFEEKHGCKPPRHILGKPWWDQFGLVFLRGMIRAAGEHRVLAYHRSLLVERDTGGRGFSDFVNTSRFGTRKVLFTDDPENVKSALTRAEDFVVEPARLESFGPLLGKGIFTADGAHWQHSRNMLKPQFEKRQIMELEQFERHVPNLLANIPDDGGTVELQELFHNFTMDTSTEFLTGTSTKSLSTDEQGARAKDFVATFEKSMDDCTLHARVGRLYSLLPHFAAKRSHRLCRRYIGEWVDRAMAFKQRNGHEKAKKGEQYCFLNELVKHDEVDRTRAVNETMNILLAGRDTTASLLSHLFFHLAREPELDGQLPTYEQLRNMKYLRYCSQEALRLHPPVPILGKHAARDTFLPHGGGPTGLSPLFMAQGDIIVYNSYSMHRSTTLYSSDSNLFRPERWADPGLRPFWGYIPFGGGQRVCLGQQYALAEGYYVTVRLMQEFGRIERRGEVGWEERLTATLGCRDGVRVGLWRE
ncbi:Cytochrome P450 monooxygenase himC [Fulvia fulva]|nr:Cytochrome P450 monooxygenase himC [Fulvia fulva]WPV23586.1 Cytochrome P450 monooxygenase himC [Fulvia fulva]